MNEIYFSERIFRLKEQVRAFLKEELEPIKEEINRTKEIPPSIIRKMGNEGFFGPLIPREFNGTELGMVSHCMITEEISRLNVAVSVTRTPCILNGFLINNFGNISQKENYLRRLEKTRCKMSFWHP